jgi:hypothetical protein
MAGYGLLLSWFLLKKTSEKEKLIQTNADILMKSLVLFLYSTKL